MIIVHSYGVAVIMCFITMLCWGSWANTQKLAGKEWPFQLFYWDYSIGVLLFSLGLALTIGSMGTEGRAFITDLKQAEFHYFGLAFIGGVIFNAANLLLVSAIDIAGMAVAFPIGIGLALVVGVVSTYLVDPTGNPLILSVGVISIIVAIILNATAYKKSSARDEHGASFKGITLSVLCGVLMGLFYRYVAASMPSNLSGLNLQSELGKITPYTALVVFSLGLLVSDFLFNSIVMKKPLKGAPVLFCGYFKKGSVGLHSIGILGGVIWGIGMSFSILAGDVAGYAISYGLGQCATMIAALWGIIVWKEFKSAPPIAFKLLTGMFVFFIAGIVMIIMARLVV